MKKVNKTEKQLSQEMQGLVLYQLYDPITYKMLNEGGFYEEGQQPTNSTSLQNNCVIGYYDPVNNLIYETATLQEIYDAKAPGYLNNIKTYYTNMLNMAFNCYVGKSEIEGYAPLKKEENLEKYQVAKGFLVNSFVTGNINLILDREYPGTALDDALINSGLPVTGTRYEQICSLIVKEYETSKAIYDEQKYFIREFRAKCEYWVSQFQWAKIDSAYGVVQNITEETTIEDARNLFDMFNLI